VFYAAQEGQEVALRLLIRSGASTEKGCSYRDSDYFRRKVTGGKYAVYEEATPLMVALTQQSLKAVATLLESGADPNRSCRKYQFQSPNRFTCRWQPECK